MGFWIFGSGKRRKYSEGSEEDERRVYHFWIQVERMRSVLFVRVVGVKQGET